MDPTTATSSIGSFAEKFGFPALLVLVLLYGIYLMQMRADKKQEQRDADDKQREKDRRDEREADRKAHVEALGQNTSALGNLGSIVQRVESKVDTALARAEAEALRLVKGGG